MFDNFDYSLVDFGEGRKLERFGDLLVDRPSPQSICNKSYNKDIWDQVDAYFDREKGWILKDESSSDWEISIFDSKVKLRFASAGQVGIFPEQYENWDFLRKISLSMGEDERILNVFSYTGVSNIALKGFGGEIVHLDGSKSSVNWAKENARLNELKCKVRFIVEDAMTFMVKEVKRGKRYNGFILDPPEFGRGPGGDWSLKRDIELLTDILNRITDRPRFFIFTTHSQWVDKKNLRKYLSRIDFLKKYLDIFELKIKSESGKFLDMGLCGRWSSIIV
ncbi:MAG: class I SAM-dependent methyltransferase [Calditerrivibrio sp.]|nr:class I SAM-dependent methyltransferase [Calditerrivibrio sp.]